MDCFARAARRFGLTISIKKTEFIHQSARGQLATPRAISVEYNNINCVKSLCYLGSTLYPQTRRYMTKLLLVSSKQAPPSGRSATDCGRCTTSDWRRRSQCIVLSFSRHYCTAVKAGASTDDSCANSSNSVGVVFGTLRGSVGRTRRPTLTCWRGVSLTA